MCLGVIVLVSCTHTDDFPVRATDEISLGVAKGVTSRAGIRDLVALSADGTRVGIYGVATSNADATIVLGSDWVASPLMNNVQTTAVDASTGAISWGSMVYNYPQDNTKNVKFCAYYPYAITGNVGANYIEAGVGTSPLLHFTLTGAEDVMWAIPVLGSRILEASSLTFNHVLTQLSFQFVDDEGKFTDRITGINFTGTNTVSTLNLETGTWGNWGTPSSAIALSGVTYPLSVTGTTGAPQKVGTEIMFQPGQSSFQMNFSLETNGSKLIAIRPVGEPVFKAGKAYLITIRFSGNIPIQLGATVVPWEQGGIGDGVVD